MEKREEPGQDEIYESVYEVLETIEKKKEEVISAFFELENIELTKENLGRLKLITFPEKPDYTELLFNEEMILSFDVSYADVVPKLIVQTSDRLSSKLKELANTSKDELF